MTALAADRNTPFRDGKEFEYPCAASKTFYAGAIVVLDASGNAEPATTATGKIGVGVCQEGLTSTTAAAEKVKVKAGVFRLANGETITKAHIGDAAYASDDQTIMRTATGRSQVGTIVDVDSEGVWVAFSAPLAAAATGLTAANNLSDLGTVATARANLGLDTGDAPTFDGLTLTGAVAGDATTNIAINTNKFTVAAATGNTVVAGTLDVAGAATGLCKTQTVAAGAYLVTAADGGIKIFAGADNDVVTLPDAAAGNLGLAVDVICSAGDGAAKVSVSPHSSDKIYGGINGAAGGALVTFGAVANKDIILTKATQLKGDYVRLVSDGTSGWYVVGGQGVWASEG